MIKKRKATDGNAPVMEEGRVISSDSASVIGASSSSVAVATTTWPESTPIPQTEDKIHEGEIHDLTAIIRELEASKKEVGAQRRINKALNEKFARLMTTADKQNRENTKLLIENKRLKGIVSAQEQLLEQKANQQAALRTLVTGDIEPGSAFRQVLVLRPFGEIPTTDQSLQQSTPVSSLVAPPLPQPRTQAVQASVQR